MTKPHGPRGGRALHVRAVPWTTPTEEKVKGALGELPAYVRRAKRLDDSIEALWTAAREARTGLLGWVCLRLRRLLDALPTPPEEPAIKALLAEVRDLPAFRRLRPRTLLAPRKGEASRRLADLGTSTARFNAAWERWTREEAPLDAVNSKIEGYNRHFAFERQCAARYVPFNRLTFHKRPKLTRRDILDRHPLLPLA